MTGCCPRLLGRHAAICSAGLRRSLAAEQYRGGRTDGPPSSKIGPIGRYLISLLDPIFMLFTNAVTGGHLALNITRVLAYTCGHRENAVPRSFPLRAWARVHLSALCNDVSDDA